MYNRKGKWVCASLLIAALAVSVYGAADINGTAQAISTVKPTPTPAPTAYVPPQRDPNAGAYRPQPTPEPKPYVVFPGWAEITVEADSLDAWIPFYTPEKNEGWYDLTFELWAALPEEAIEEDTETQLVEETDEETGETREVLYAKLSQSGLVAAGLYLQEVTLLQTVPEGSYKAFVHMQPYYVEDGMPTPNNGRIAILLNAVNFN